MPGRQTTKEPYFSKHTQAVILGLLVTFLWSSSYILIKIGLQSNLPPITFAGLRYTLAFLSLIPWVVFNSTNRSQLSSISRSGWIKLILLGLMFYTITQGAQFISLFFLPAATNSLVLNLTPVIVAFAGIFFLSEHPALSQWIGIGICIIGVSFYFFPVIFEFNLIIGLGITILGLFSNSASSLLGRNINRKGNLSPILVTTISMGVGAIVLLICGVFMQGFGEMLLIHWLIIAWLALINTALAFTLWNTSLQTLTAFESSVINNTMLPQIVILAWIFLGEQPTLKEWLGLFLVGLGTLIVQFKRGSTLNQDNR
jgi:drug/metabolite transporter (DMT)-like permease